MSPSPCQLVPISPTSKNNESYIEKYVSAFMLKSRQSIWRHWVQNESVLHVQYTEIYLESLYFNAQQRLLKWSLVNNSHNIYHRNHMNRIFYKNTSSDRSTDLWFNYFASLGIFMRQGRTRTHRYKIFNVFVTKISPFYEQQQKKDICTVWLNCSKL